MAGRWVGCKKAVKLQGEGDGLWVYSARRASTGFNGFIFGGARRGTPGHGTEGRAGAGRDCSTSDAGSSPSDLAVILMAPGSLDDWTMTSARPLNALRRQGTAGGSSCRRSATPLLRPAGSGP